jgi:hypothetical protein
MRLVDGCDAFLPMLIPLRLALTGADARLRAAYPIGTVILA